MSELSVGMGIKAEDDGKLYAVMQFAVGQVGEIAIRFTNQDNYDQDIAALIGGLMQLRADFKEQSSGLIVAKGVDDASLRNPQGRQQRSQGGKGA